MLHGTLCEIAEVTGTHPDLDSTTCVPASCTPRPTCPPEGPHLHSSLAACLSMVLVVLSLTLCGPQDLESHHAVMRQPRGLVVLPWLFSNSQDVTSSHSRGTCILRGSVVWGRDEDSSWPESVGPLVCSHLGVPTTR